MHIVRYHNDSDIHAWHGVGHEFASEGKRNRLRIGKNKTTLFFLGVFLLFSLRARRVDRPKCVPFSRICDVIRYHPEVRIGCVFVPAHTGVPLYINEQPRSFDFSLMVFFHVRTIFAHTACLSQKGGRGCETLSPFPGEFRAPHGATPRGVVPP